MPPVVEEPVPPVVPEVLVLKFVSVLARHDLVGSMGRVGAAGDNAAMESFFALLQKNVLDRPPGGSRSSPGSSGPTTDAGGRNAWPD